MNNFEEVLKAVIKDPIINCVKVEREGKPVYRVFVKSQSTGGESPYMWECDYEDLPLIDVELQYDDKSLVTVMPDEETVFILDYGD